MKLASVVKSVWAVATVVCLLALLVISGISSESAASEGGEAQGSERPDCRDSKLLSPKLITDICWTCMFPIKVAGVTLIPGESREPPGTASKPVCICNNKDLIPKFGLSFAMWMPSRVVEIVRAPGCSMALGGITLPIGDKRQQGTTGKAEYDSGDIAFYHYHTYSFPILYMMDLFVDGLCFSDGYLDFDLMFMSELDPTWSEDELSFFFFLESAAVANPVAISACGIDMTAASFDRPIDELFWCAGGWGHLYPMSGHHKAWGSLAQDSSLLATRALAIAHRRGLAWRTKGNDAMCGGKLDPIFPKTQYRMSMFFPVTEARSTVRSKATIDDGSGTNQEIDAGKQISSKGSHVIGLSTFLWGEWRQIPAIGEDALYIIFRWVDCCIGILGGDRGGI